MAISSNSEEGVRLSIQQAVQNYIFTRENIKTSIMVFRSPFTSALPEIKILLEHDDYKETIIIEDIFRWSNDPADISAWEMKKFSDNLIASVLQFNQNYLQHCLNKL